MIQTKVQKWGNSYAVRLPKPMVERLQVRKGSPIKLDEHGHVVTIRKVQPHKRVTTQDWRDYLIPMKRGRKENISGRIDEILYGKPRR